MTRFALLLALVACGPEKNAHPTKAGTEFLHWELATSDRETIRAAKQTDVKSQTLDYTALLAGEEKLPFKVKVQLETATVTFEEAGKQVEHRAPVKLSLTVVDGNDFTLSNAKCGGPHYNMELPPGRDMILHCTAHAKKPRYDIGFTFYAYGDGRIDDGNPKMIKVYP
jgi:hypothetical protein